MLVQFFNVGPKRKSWERRFGGVPTIPQLSLELRAMRIEFDALETSQMDPTGGRILLKGKEIGTWKAVANG